MDVGWNALDQDVSRHLAAGALLGSHGLRRPHEFRRAPRNRFDMFDLQRHLDVDGANWTEQHPLNPLRGISRTGIRRRHGLGDGLCRQRLDLDMDGTNWAELHPVHSPLARAEASIAYDPATHQVVLFGGVAGMCCGKPPYLNQTWTWDGRNWSELHALSSPPPSMDPLQRRSGGGIMLFGGRLVKTGALVRTTYVLGTGRP